MSSTVNLEWKFSPDDYFEEAISISAINYSMTIENGQIEAVIDASVFDADPGLRERLHQELEGRFLAVQLLTHKPYELSRSSLSRVHADGRRDVFVEVETANFNISGGVIDLQVVDSDGTVKVDTKRDRIQEKRRLGEVVPGHLYHDTLLISMLRSYQAAVRDPDDELVHLYEIRDALADNFGSHKVVKTALGISDTSWSRFERLCNEGSLRQGRHRGKGSGQLRNASSAELEEAREIARSMISGYLRYLEND
jgi:hypothetical protein